MSGESPTLWSAAYSWPVFQRVTPQSPLWEDQGALGFLPQGTLVSVPLGLCRSFASHGHATSLILRFPFCTVETIIPHPLSRRLLCLSPTALWHPGGPNGSRLPAFSKIPMRLQIGCTQECLIQEPFREAEYFWCNDLRILSNVYFNTNTGHAIICVWNIPAMSSFPII